MKKISTLVLSSLLFAGFSMNVSADDSDHSHANTECEHAELGDHMQEIKDAFKGLRKASDLDSKLVLIETLKSNSEAALLLTPMMFNDMADEAKQVAFMTAYKDGISDMIVMLDEFEAAAKINDKSAQRDLIKKLGKHSKESHVDFKKDCD
jgi:hypothetical protein